MKNKHLILVYILILSLLLPNIGYAETDFQPLMPQHGTSIKSIGRLTIDFSNYTEGYIMLRTTPTEKRMKIVVIHDDNERIQYDIKNTGEYEVFPLQYGNGNYNFVLYENMYDTKYQRLESITIKVNMPDTNKCFLYPNQYVNYTKDMLAIQYAQDLCKGITDPQEKVNTIFTAICWEDETHFIRNTDGTITAYRRAKNKYGTISDDYIPAIEQTFRENMGVCRDWAGLLTAMLRSVGVPTKFMVGTYMNEGHAWISVIIHGQEHEMDPTYQLSEIPPEEKINYHVERWY